MINFGRYNQRVTFCREQRTLNDFNESVVSLQDVITRSCRVVNKTNSVSKDNFPTTHKVIEIRVRYTDVITDDMQVKFNKELFKIDSVVDYDFKRSELVITATITRGMND